MSQPSTSSRPIIEGLESRQLFSFSLPGLDQYIPAPVLDIVSRFTPLGPVLGAYSGLASLTSGGASNAATIKILKQTAAGIIKGRLSLPNAGLSGLPFSGKLDQKGVLRALVNRNGVAGSIIGKFVGGKFNGKFNIADAAQKFSGLLKLLKG
jgi:hypothetical protein